MIALRAIAPLHHPLNRYAVIGRALRRVLVDHGRRFLGRPPPLRVRARAMRDRPQSFRSPRWQPTPWTVMAVRSKA